MYALSPYKVLIESISNLIQSPLDALKEFTQNQNKFPECFHLNVKSELILKIDSYESEISKMA